MSDNIQRAAEILLKSRKLAILTGAGVSKESGVPTFRDAVDGLWARYDPHQLATAAAFRQEPKLVWDWYEYRRGLVSNAKPNPGHLALARLEKHLPEVIVITQNVDALHEEAGSTHVVHLHGKIARNKCFYNCQGDPTIIDVSKLEWDTENGPPACPHCGRWVRPDVVWFGEILPANEIEAAYEATITCDVMLVVGTSGLISPASTLPEVARRRGATVIEVNPQETPITSVAHVHLNGASGEMLPRVVDALETLLRDNA